MCALCGPDRAQLVIDHDIHHSFELKAGSDMECSVCGRHVAVHPDKMEFLKRHEMETIIKHGHQVRVVVGETPFAYSIGRTVKDRPELLVTGPLPPNLMGWMVNEVARIDDECPLSAGMELGQILVGYPVRLAQVGNLDQAQMFGVTNSFGSDDTSALQILWPDMQGHFPGDADFDPGIHEPVFFEEPPRVMKAAAN